jgi:hypothetical protein
VALIPCHRRAAVGALALLLAATACPTAEPEERSVSDAALAWDPSLTDSFWDLPFPSDLRLTEDGRPEWRGFPNPGQTPLVDKYLEFGRTNMFGWGLNSPTWFHFDAPVVLPPSTDATAADSQRCEGSVLIVDVDESSPEYGTCRPARWLVIDDTIADAFVPANTVAVAPYWGFPLRSATTYAVVLVDVQDPEGGWLTTSPALGAELAGEGIYASLADLLAARPELAGAEADPSWIAAATVFTTQDVFGEMRALADRAVADPALPRWTGDLIDVADDHEHHNGDFEQVEGTYVAANFQRGELPYASEGGGFEWDAGVPVVQDEEAIPFVVGLPRVTFEQPAAGWPIVIQSHGTFGDRWSHFDGGGDYKPAEMAARRGFMSIGIAQPLHGARWPDGNDLARQLYSFNYFNPEAGISTFRQAAIDTVSLVELLKREFTAGGGIATARPDLRIDPDRIYYLGHSQGGMTGAIAIPFTADVRAWILSGAGGGLSITVMQRNEPIVIRDTLAEAVGAGDGSELYEMHPLVGMVQALAERTDPINYAPGYVYESTSTPTSVLLTEGLLDADTPPDSSEALAVAGRLSMASGYEERLVPGMALRGLPTLDTPFRGNAIHPSGTPVTAALAQFDANHFAIFGRQSAAELYANFLWSEVRDGEPGEIGADFP